MIPWSAGYEGGPNYSLPGPSNAGQAYDCQDGGWNPEGNKETAERVNKPGTAEEETFNKAGSSAVALSRVLLVTPHQLLRLVRSCWRCDQVERYHA